MPPRSFCPSLSVNGTSWEKPRLIHVLVLGYTFLNMILIFRITLEARLDALCPVNMGCIVLVDLYILYFAKNSDEKAKYERRISITPPQNTRPGSEKC